MKVVSYVHPSRTFLPCSGVGRHINNLLLALYEKDNVDLSLFFTSQWLSSNGMLPANAPLRDLPFRTINLRERLLERSWKALNWPKMDSIFGNADWVFSPAETYIPLRNIPSAVTLHDIQAFEDHLPWSTSSDHLSFKRRWKMWIPKLVRNTDLIFTVSQYSRSRLIERLGLPEEKVKISGNAVDPAFLEKAQAIKPKPLDYPYLVVIGGLRPKKGGLEILSVAKLLSECWPEVRLISWGEHDPALVEKAKELPNVMLRNMITDEEMIEWLKGAHASLFLSWYEGFGLPVLESMACGVPVICSDKASLPEIAGDAALLVSPDELDKIVDYILQLKNSSLGNDLRKKGYLNCRRYNWDTAAENVVNAFEHYRG